MFSADPTKYSEVLNRCLPQGRCIFQQHSNVIDHDPMIIVAITWKRLSSCQLYPTHVLFSPLSREVIFQNIFGYYSFISIILSTALYVCQHHPCIWLLTKGFLGNSFFCASLTQPSMNLSCQLPLQWTHACWKLYFCISLSGYVCIIIEASLTYYSIFHKANNFPLHHNFCKLREAASRRSSLF